MTKYDLRQYRHIVREHTQLTEALAETEASMSSPGARPLDGMPHNPQTALNSVEHHFVNGIALRERYVQRLEEIDKYRRAVDAALSALPSRERTLMRAHYIQGCRWEEIAERENYSVRQVHRIHARALEAIRDK